MENHLIQIDPFEEGNFEAAPIDGFGNNLENPEYGAANTALLNIVPLDYSDGFSTAAGADRPGVKPPGAPPCGPWCPERCPPSPP